MLDQLERFNQSLQDRVEEATRDLSLRNAQLAASQHQLLALASRWRAPNASPRSARSPPTSRIRPARR